MSIWQILLGGAVLLVIALFGAVWAFQRWGIYRFEQTAQSPADLGLDRIIVRRFQSEDGASIKAWLAEPKAGAAVIIGFYGNYSGIGTSVQRLMPLVDQGYGLAMLQYRGSSGDNGTASEANFAMDARALYDQLDAMLGSEIPAERRVLHGFSLGSAVGARLASERNFAAVILEAPFPRACAYYAARYRGFPFCALMWSERFDVIDRIDRVSAPKLFVHGARDTSIPVVWAERIFDAAPEPKRFVSFPDGGHSDLMEQGLLGEIEQFVEDVLR